MEQLSHHRRMVHRPLRKGGSRSSDKQIEEPIPEAQEWVSEEEDEVLPAYEEKRKPQNFEIEEIPHHQ